MVVRSVVLRFGAKPFASHKPCVPSWDLVGDYPMARKNPKRRLIAKLKQWDAQAHEMTKAYNHEAINSSAPVRSSLQSFKTSHALRPPKGWSVTPKGQTPPDEPGARKGKIVSGKFKPDRGTLKRFGRD